jgi:hypothetical protein
LDSKQGKKGSIKDPGKKIGRDKWFFVELKETKRRTDEKYLCSAEKKLDQINQIRQAGIYKGVLPDTSTGLKVPAHAACMTNVLIVGFPVSCSRLCVEAKLSCKCKIVAGAVATRVPRHFDQHTTRGY